MPFKNTTFMISRIFAHAGRVVAKENAKEFLNNKIKALDPFLIDKEKHEETQKLFDDATFFIKNLDAENSLKLSADQQIAFDKLN